MRELLQGYAAQFEARLGRMAHDMPALGPVLCGGKHLRPVLCLMVAEAVAGDPERAMGSALALEMIHCGALLHDDVYDRDQLRRGVPTLWSQLGDRAAMVLGDLLLGLAFQTMPDNGAAVLARCIGELSRASFQEMFRSRWPTAEEGLSILIGKTASLFRTACHLGALAGQVPDGTRQALAAYGEHVGIAYQIADDLVDIRRSLQAHCFLGDLQARMPSFPLLSVPFPDGVLRRYAEGEGLDEGQFLEVVQAVGCEPTALRQIAEHQAAACQALAPVLSAPHLSQFAYYAVEQLLAE